MKNTITHVVTGAGLIGAGLLPAFAQADFIKDSRASLELKTTTSTATTAKARASPSARNGRRAFCLTCSRVSPKAPSVLASTPSACSA